MHVISRKKLKEAAEKHSGLAAALDTWFRVAKRAKWRHIDDVRQTYPHADAVGDYTVFNIKGNEYRLIVKIRYAVGRIYVKHVLTHAEYSKGGWRK